MAALPFSGLGAAVRRAGACSAGGLPRSRSALGSLAAIVHARRRRSGAPRRAPCSTDCSAARMVASVSLPIVSTSFFELSSSLSRMASSNWARNSPACRLMMPMYLPIVRSSAGRSFGPMTSSATMPRIKSLLEVMSNIGSTYGAIAARAHACTHARAGGRDASQASIDARPGAPAGLVGSARRRARPACGAPRRSTWLERPSAARPSWRVSSSSAMPFLKLLMPLATSPMIEEILPLPPNSSRATARKMQPVPDAQATHFAIAPLAAAAACACAFGALSQKGLLGQVCHTLICA